MKRRYTSLTMYDAPQHRCVSMVLMKAARKVATISPRSPGGHQLADHHGVGELGIGGQRGVHGRGGEDQQRSETDHDPRPCEQDRPREGEPERCLDRLALVPGREQALGDVAVALSAPQPEDADEAEEGDDLERRGIGGGRHQVEGAGRGLWDVLDGFGHGGGAAEAGQNDAGEGHCAPSMPAMNWSRSVTTTPQSPEATV